MADLGVTGHLSDAARKDVEFLGKIKITEGGGCVSRTILLNRIRGLLIGTQPVWTFGLIGLTNLVG